MKRKNDDMLVDFRGTSNPWAACLDALETDFTLSIKQACQMLKCSRAWLQKYIRPHVHYIYLSNAMVAGQRNPAGVDYVQLARSALERDDIRESTWLHRGEFEALIRDNMTFTRQIISVPIELFVDKDKISSFQVAYKALEEKRKELFGHKTIDWEAVKAAQGELEALKEKSWDQICQEYVDSAPTPYKRSATPAVPCRPSQVFDLNDMVAVHDIKNYGDTDEEIYRRLYNEGYYRIQIDLPSADNPGEVGSTKIYYLEPDENEKKQLIKVLGIASSVEWVPMTFAVFADLLRQKGLQLLP